MISLTAFVLVIISTILSGLSPILLKRGAQRFTADVRAVIRDPAILCNKNMLKGVGLSVVSVFLNIIALRENQLATITPLTSLVYVWACVFSTRLLGETMTLRKWLGVAVIITGIVLVTIAA